MITALIYVLIYSLFILAINSLSVAKKAYRGNLYALIAMTIALVLGLKELATPHLLIALSAIVLGAIIGIISAKKIQMPALPQMIAIFNGFGGLSAALVGISESTSLPHPTFLLIFIVAIGAITFSGSVAAFLKLANINLISDTESLRAVNFIIFILSLAGAFYAYNGGIEYIIGFAALISLWAFVFTLPIGGADMPIIISVLNSLSGWSTVLVGFSQNNILLIIIGTLIGASGTILSYIMTKAMNRSLLNVIFQQATTSSIGTIEQKPINQGTPEDAAFLLENAEKIIIVPGYGMAASGAQHELANMAHILKTKYKAEVMFAIHPVAGRMPGHMNVLLAEANVDPDDVFELKDINQEFQTADVTYVIGANDTTNPLAKTEAGSPIYQMPILEVEQSRKILFVKRSLAPGYAGIDNPLFYAKNTIMLLGDAKDITKQIVSDLEEDS